MWQCVQCGEAVDEPFEACWKCGAGRDGVIDLKSQAVEDDPSVPDPGPLAEGPDGATTNAPDPALAGLTRFEIAKLVCQALALLNAAACLMLALDGYREASLRYEFNLIHLLPAIGPGVAALVLWLFDEGIAGQMARDNTTPVTHATLTAGDLVVVTFTAVGMYLFVDGLRNLAKLIAFANSYHLEDVDLFSSPEMWGNCVQLAAALWLLFGSRGIARLVFWLRNAGRMESASSEP